jgi:prepilin-type N-terminal cleavage/methylation domain-containing protein/prepilin-type processing-associated H-X9-DG protein
MKKKGFTLVELLVVIAIIALLMGILMPALARVRMIAYRMICGTNLAGIGKAVLLYAGDSKEAYPLPGCTSMAQLATGGNIASWCAQTSSTDAYGGSRGTNILPGYGTIGSVFYLLIRYEDTSVKQFNCKGDVGVRTFKLTDWAAGGTPAYTPPTNCATTAAPTVEDLTKCWDFGAAPGVYCSYSYQNPYALGGTPGQAASSGFGPNASSPPSMPIAADRNPLLDTNVNYIESGGGAVPGGQIPNSTTNTDKTPWQDWANNNSEYKDKDLTFNSFAHQREGQNVLYIDGHVVFSKTANCGIDNDNIWQHWNSDGTQPANGKPEKSIREAGGYFPIKKWTAGGNFGAAYETALKDTAPCGSDDAYLINENQLSGTRPPR